MGAKILVVDDEPNLLRLIGYALHIAGYATLIAQDGREALKKARAERPDLVILDVMLPDMSGIEICKRLRDDPETAVLPIIMLSAKTQPADRISGLKAGADEYVSKPIDTDEMIARVAALLERTQRLRQVATPAQPHGKALGFIGAKGGVGTTTVTLNVATALAVQKKPVVAAELRSCYGTFAQCASKLPLQNLTHLLELEPTRIGTREIGACLTNLPSGLRLLCGPQKVDEFKEVAPEQAEAIVTALTRLSEYALLDLPCIPCDASRAAVRLCDFIALVVEPEPACLSAAKITLNLLHAWGVNRGAIGCVVVRRAPTAQSLRPADIRSQLDCEVVGVVVPAAEEMAMAYRQSAPLVLVQPNHVAAMSLTTIANNLSGEMIKGLSFG